MFGIWNTSNILQAIWKRLLFSWNSFKHTVSKYKKKTQLLFEKLYFNRSEKKQESPLNINPLNHNILLDRASCNSYPDNIITFILCTATRKAKESNILAASHWRTHLSATNRLIRRNSHRSSPKSIGLNAVV